RGGHRGGARAYRGAVRAHPRPAPALAPLAGWRGALPRQSAYTPAFLMIGAHCSISAFRCARAASGVARLSATGSVPSSANFDTTAGSFSAVLSAAESLSITGLGVPAGAHMPCHTATSKPLSPDS